MIRQQWLKTGFALVVASGIFAAGCKKDETTSSSAPAPTAPAAPTISNTSSINSNQ